MNPSLLRFALLTLVGITFTYAQLSPNIEKDFMEFSDGTSVPITWSLTNLVYKLRALWNGDAQVEEQEKTSGGNAESAHLNPISSQQLNIPELRHILEEAEEFKPRTLRLKSKPMNIPQDDDDEL